jgi:excisionase family DNA binding protein
MSRNHPGEFSGDLLLDALAERVAEKVAARLAAQTAAPSSRLAYTVPEAAEALGLSERQVWRLVQARKVATITTPGTRRRLIPAAELKRLVTEGAA